MVKKILDNDRASIKKNPDRHRNQSLSLSLEFGSCPMPPQNFIKIRSYFGSNPADINRLIQKHGLHRRFVSAEVIKIHVTDQQNQTTLQCYVFATLYNVTK